KLETSNTSTTSSHSTNSAMNSATLGQILPNRLDAALCFTGFRGGVERVGAGVAAGVAVIRVSVFVDMSGHRPGLEVVAQVADVLSELRVLEDLGGARPLEVDLDGLDDPPGVRTHHVDDVREEDRLGDRVRDEDDGLPRRRPDLRELDVHLVSGHRVERPERFVHE